MTRIGNSLCRLTRAKRPFADADLNIIQAHLDAMRLVLAQNIRGDGGPLGAEASLMVGSLIHGVSLGPNVWVDGTEVSAAGGQRREGQVQRAAAHLLDEHRRGACGTMPAIELAEVRTSMKSVYQKKGSLK